MVFGYSEGAQVATKWLRDYGISSPVTPTSRLSFLLIGNAERRYGGFAYRHDNLAAICDVDGLPDPLSDGTSTVPYAVTDFARQYDGFADFPSASDIQQAVDSVGAAVSDPFNWALRALQDVTNAVIGAHADAALNAVLGMQMVHTNYFTVTPDDLHNVRYTDPDHPLVEYVWSPTYPVPLLGIGQTFPSLDREKRKVIEQAYSRPVVIPQPNYAQISLFTTDYFATDEDFRRVEETGWFPEIVAYGHVSMSLTPSMGSSAYIGQVATTMSLTVGMSATAIGKGGSFNRTVSMSLTASMGADAAGASVADVSMSLSAGMSVAGGEQYVRTVSMSLTPLLTATGAESYVRDVALGLAAAMDVDGAGVSVVEAAMSLLSAMSVDAAGSSAGSVDMSLTAALGSRTPSSVAASVELDLIPGMSVAGGSTAETSVDLGLVAGVGAAATPTVAGEADLALTAAMTTSGQGASVASADLALVAAMGVAAVEDSGYVTTSVSMGLSVSMSVAGVGVDGAMEMLYIAGDSDVKKWDGITLTPVISTGLSVPSGLAFDATGNLYISEQHADDIKKWDGSSLTTVISSGIDYPNGLAFDDSGDLYIAEYTAGDIKKWDGSSLTTVLTGLSYPSGLTFDASGNLYILDLNAGAMKRWDGSNLTTVLTGLNIPVGLACNSSGDFYIAETFPTAVKKWDGTSLTDVTPPGLDRPAGLTFGPA